MVYDLGVVKRQRYVAPDFIGFGGTVSNTSTSGVNYTYHTFTSSGTFVAVYPITVNLLIVNSGDAVRPGGYITSSTTIQPGQLFIISRNDPTTATNSIIGPNFNLTSPTNSGTISDVGYTWLDGKTYSRGSNNAGTVAASGNNNSTGVTIIRYVKYVANTLPLFDPNFLYTSLLLSNQSNTLTFSNGTVSMLLVAGGGGGGNPASPGSGGGGGAGGLYINSFVPFSNTTLYVTVGAGGGGGGSDGSNTTVTGKLTGSVSETITVNGGGRGGTAQGTTGGAGGSGGGGGSGYPSFSYGGGASTSPTSFGPNYYGNSGGPAGSYGTGGGGGAGSAGATSPGGGGGGAGGGSLFVTVASLESPWSSSYAKGGNGGAGGSAASPNTGNGGNGAAGNYDSGLAGGSGIAIFWHLESLPISTFGSSSSYSISIVNGYKIYTFINGSGFITFGTDHGNEYIKDDSVYNNNVTGFVQTSKMLTQGSFNPYSTNWSTYLNGTTDYLSIQHSDAFNISSDFTLEGWFYATSSTNSTIISKSITSVGTMNLTPFEIKLSSQNILTTVVSLINPAPTYAVEYLVVAGGGGGDTSNGGGGGGAGGFRSGTFITQTSTSITYTITVGGGGGVSSTGGQSAISGGGESIVSAGGGAGASRLSTGGSGGSGGGGGIGGAGVSGQGNNGGSGYSNQTAGGGGGAGAVGGNSSDQYGGSGLPSSISGSSIYYAGGGGGGGATGNNGFLGRTGGQGGGGNGGGLFGGGSTAGTDGLGGGGGGDSAGAKGGGSGVVFISYSANYEPALYTGSPTITTSGGNRIYKFLSGGTITLIIPLYPKYTILSSQANNNTWNHISLSRSQLTFKSILNGSDAQSGSITPPPPTVEYLVVAGGGAGGGAVSGNNAYAGGGGGGGLRTASGFAVASAVTFTVTVGGGAASQALAGASGGNSVFSTITSLGGGGGGGVNAGPTNVGGNTGGAGGGGMWQNISAGFGTAGQGNNGGNGAAGSPGGSTGGTGSGLAGGGGGGSGGGFNAGGGGAGGYYTISGAGVYYAGGGGGGGVNVANQGAGGLGGGGGGGSYTNNVNGSPGTTNTGGGGGGAGGASGNNGGAGGSGIVIIRYAETYAAASATTGSPTITVAGGYRVYKWTTSGSIAWATSILALPIYNNTGTIYIGYNGTNYFQGYISNFRLLNGTSVTALPRLPFSKVENTTFLISANNRINDKSDYNFTITRNGTPRVQKFSPFVNSGVYNKLVLGGSIYFNGISDYISVPPYSFDFKGYNFNIEFWAYPEAISSTAYLICTGTPGSNGIYLAMYTSGVLNFVIGNNIVNFASTNSPELTVRFREWNHIAVVRNNTLISLYINSNFAGSTSTSASISTILEYPYNTLEAPTSWYTNNVSIGRLMDSDSGYYKGYLSNLRVLKGNISERLVTTYGTTGTSIEYLIVAGGGGGAAAIGGGAGGFRYGSFITTQSTATYIITIGSGGSSSSKGIDSSIVGGGQNIVSTGGGSFAVSNGSGGSGSGGSGAGNSPSTSPSQGNNGGASVGGSTHGAGGGGAGGVGSSPTGSTGGAGGPGATSSISGSSTYYAGGGGGGTNVGGGIVGGAGGIGGGANGQQGGNPGGFSGTTNTGGGGGGGGPNVYGPAVGGSGGSGIVIIRYLGQPRGLGGNITTNVYGLYTVHIFLSTDTYIDNKTTYILPSAPILANTLQSPGFTINYMVVAGGGGGGSGGYQTTGGGGGAGGLTLGGFTTTNSMGLLTITVGSGGAGAATGFPSSIFGINIPPRLIAIGGGYGGGTTGGAGGSGGGGFSNLNSWSNYGGISTQNTAGRNGSGTGYGNAGRGGGSIYDNNTLGGGGGGAGSIGYLGGPGGTGGLGGDGLYVNVANSSTYSGIYSVGGARGGSLTGGSNTGNGGGGGGDNTSPGGGGSGKVIIWHTTTLATSPTTTGTPGVYTTNSYKVYVFNTSGTLDFKYSDTSLLLNFAEAKIFDATAQNDIYSIGNVSLSTSIVKYNNASIYFNGNGVNGLGIVSTGTTNLIAIGYSNFTVEMWMYPLSLYNAGTAPALLDSRTTTSGAGTAFLGYTGETLPAGSQIGWKDNTSFVTTGTVIINSWNHVAVTRVGSLLSMYINGVVTSSTTNTTNYSVPFKYIGISYNSLSFNGYIDDLRITQNARYTAAFTPSAFVPQLK